MKKIILIATLLLLSACNDVRKTHDYAFVLPIPKQCQGLDVYHGVVRQQYPVEAGLYLELSDKRRPLNLGKIEDKSLIGKTILISGSIRPAYPPGGKPRNGNHYGVLFGGQLLGVINSQRDIKRITQRCQGKK